MPKVVLPPLPLSGIFAVSKPSGPTSMSVLEDIKRLVGNSRLFVDARKLENRPTKGNRKRRKDTVKIGQGGTLDPLADGVLGKTYSSVSAKVPNGSLTFWIASRYFTPLDHPSYSEFSARMYRSIGPLPFWAAKQIAMIVMGPVCATLRGAMSPKKQWRRTSINSEARYTKHHPCLYLLPFPCPHLSIFVRFSALKMDGKPLYEYARQGIPLPRPIEKRKVTVHSLNLVDWMGCNHNFRWPQKEFSPDQKAALQTALKSVEVDPVIQDKPDEHTGEVPTAFVLSMTVSGGTYVRSIVHDLGHALGSAAHVVTLTRSRQGGFTLDPKSEEDKSCVPWDVFEKALEDEGEPGEDGWRLWEREILDRLEIVDAQRQ
ncbi:pseudouridine synthase [Boletus reticuloceps]|uniref:tRNA pseudouridine(55) synthase n=1 Tax=Boletus reticuloceps TaxID=495285 RepID=A0A8I2YST6_9AGAM|nr:pseudouridine synthase [Boletus reticuloceps]